MADAIRNALTPTQALFVERHLGGAALVEDLSWGLVDTRVLRVRRADRDYVVKAAGPGNHHIGREIAAHDAYTAPLVAGGRTAPMVAADRAANILILEYQPGRLVEGTPFASAAATHAQAGSVLRTFHDQVSRVDGEYEGRVTAKAIAWLDRPHRIPARIEAAARRILGAYRPASVIVVPTHGDWQPRNWLIYGDRVTVIDFGRFDFRPRATDLCRLATQQWGGAPELESAFLRGYGDDPRDETVWPIDLLREAIGTAAWAYMVGDVAFEEHGQRMLEAAVARFS